MILFIKLKLIYLNKIFKKDYKKILNKYKSMFYLKINFLIKLNI